MTNTEIAQSDTLEFARDAASDAVVTSADLGSVLALAFLEGDDPETALQLLDAVERVFAESTSAQQVRPLLAAAIMQTQIWIEIRDGKGGSLKRGR